MSEIDALRARLKRLTGAARARPLLDLTQLLSDAYWRAGPGKPDSLPLLDQAITAIDEAYGYFGAADPMRRNLAGVRGWLHGSRHLAHAGPVEDRDLGLRLIEEGLGAPNLSPVLGGTLRLTLGQLHMSTVTALLQQPGAMASLTSRGMPASAAADVDRAIECFEQVRDEHGMPRETREVSRTLIRMAGALRIIVTTRPGTSGVEAINRLMEAMKVFQQIHQEQSALYTVVPVGTAGAFYGADTLADQDPLDRPVPLMQSTDPAAVPRPRRNPRPAPAPGPAPTPRPASRPAPRPSSGPAPRPSSGPAPRPSSGPAPRAASGPGDDTAALRRELRERITGGGDLFPALYRLLRDPSPAPGLVDDVVALATAVVDAGAANRTDQLMLATGLCLRARAAGARRSRRDLAEAADALVEAASARSAPPEAVRVMRRVAAIVDEADPGVRAGHRLTAVLRERGGRG
ncbi:hypothetical protein [Actinoplanes sp. NPDC049802]|uniref:hypothetical protein n=1 Tax=Actinoplanes sp. NPDC049802 TaxID=3154742 RepID=UPI0033DB4E1E